MIWHPPPQIMSTDTTQGHSPFIVVSTQVASRSQVWPSLHLWSTHTSDLQIYTSCLNDTILHNPTCRGTSGQSSIKAREKQYPHTPSLLYLIRMAVTKTGLKGRPSGLCTNALHVCFPAPLATTRSKARVTNVLTTPPLPPPP